MGIGRRPAAATAGTTTASTTWPRTFRRRSKTSPSRPKVFDWVVPIEVDGEPHEIAGTLTWVPDEGGPSMAVAIGLGAAVAGQHRAGRLADPAPQRGRRSPGRGRRGLVKRLPVALIALVALAAPAAASAHAVLESTTPERGAALERAPEQVSFRFNEPVEASFGALASTTATGSRVDYGRADRTTMTARDPRRRR